MAGDKPELDARVSGPKLFDHRLFIAAKVLGILDELPVKYFILSVAGNDLLKKVSFDHAVKAHRSRKLKVDHDIRQQIAHRQGT